MSKITKLFDQIESDSCLNELNIEEISRIMDGVKIERKTSKLGLLKMGRQTWWETELQC